MSSLEPIVRQLEAHPLFHLSLGSKELFHSNFWHWLSIKNSSEVAELFFANAKPDDIVSFKREKAKRYKDKRSQADLIIYKNGKPAVVIENKTKDLATSAQLELTKLSFAAPSETFLLVTLFPPLHPVPADWKVLYYKDLSELIVPEKFSQDSFELQLIKHYKEFIALLSNLPENLTTSSDYDFTAKWDPANYELLNRIHFWESYLKLRAKTMIDEYNRMGYENDVIPHLSINRKKATIDFPILLPDNKRIGVQIEDGRFCRFINTGVSNQVLAEQLLAQNVFFDRNYRSSKKHPFLRFNPDFYYQFVELKDVHSNSELFRRINEVIDDIKNNFEAIRQILT